MGIEVPKSALPILFNFARARVASQPHVKNILLQNIFFSGQRKSKFSSIFIEDFLILSTNYYYYS